MEAISIKNFKYGLDTRREQMASLSGVLAVLRDGHINQGGECEQRKAFVPQAGTLTFGLEVLGSTMVTFGSAASPGGFPTDVVYQRLQHPDGATAMTRLVYSASYNGKAAAIAQFADDAVFAYYDGSIISDNIAGLILPYMTTATFGSNNAIAAHLDDLVNATGFVSSSLSTNVVSVTTPKGNTLSVATDVESAAGTITSVLFSTAVVPVLGTQSVGRFRVVAGTANAANYIDSVKVGVQELLTGPGTNVLWTTSNETTAGLLVTAINAYTATSGYYATQSGSTILIYASAFATTANGKDIVIIAKGNVCIGYGLFGLVNAPTASGGPVTAVASVKISGVEILTAPPINFATTIAQLCTDTAANINSGTSAGLTHGYVACGVGDVIYLSKATTSSADIPLSVLVLLTGGGVTNGNPTDSGLNPIITPNTFTTLIDTTDGVSGTSTRKLLSQSAVVVLTGGISPFTYQWELVSILMPHPQNQFIVTARTPTSYTTDFQVFYEKGFLSGGYFAGTKYEKFGLESGDVIYTTWRCKVTDAEGTVVNSNVISVNLSRLV